MNIYQRNKYVTCILMYKHNRGMVPTIFNDMFMKHTPPHNYSMGQHTASAGSIFDISKYRDTCKSSIPIFSGIAILRYFWYRTPAVR